MAVSEDTLGGAADKPKLSKIVSEKYERSKDVAYSGFEKTKEAAMRVKEGASLGVNWIKLKYNTTKIFQKK